MSLALRTLAIVALSASAVHASPLTASQILTQFNAVTTGDFTSGHDVEGRLVVLGNLTGGATFYSSPRGTAAASSFAAVNVLGNTGSFGANVNNGGNVDVLGTNNARFSLNGGALVSTPKFVASDFTTSLSALTTRLAGLSSNSTISAGDPNNFTFNAAPNAAGVAVFNTTTAALNGARNINFNLNGATTAIVNVTGKSLQTQNFNAGADVNRDVIWNFVDATSLSFQYWHGTVLALGAAVTNSTPIEGDVLAASFVGNGELHDFTFAGNLGATYNGAPVFSDPTVSAPPVTPTPEPVSLAVMGVGLLGLGVVRRALG